MNKERIIHLAGVIKTSHIYYQARFTHPWGTPACVAGHAVAEFDPAAFADEDTDLWDRAAALLDLTPEQADALFGDEDDEGLSISPTAGCAAETLRGLVNTGEVCWDL